MPADRREPAAQLPVPGGRRRELDRHAEARGYRPPRVLVMTVRDPKTGDWLRLVRPDGDTDTTTAA